VDSYQEEINKLQQSEIYLQLLAKSQPGDDNGGVALLNLVHEAVHYCYQRSKMVLKYMGEFTLHDGEHLFRVLRLMGLLIPKDSLTQLSNPELALLILTAFFHDMGMAPSEIEVRCWLGIWQNGQNPTHAELIEYDKYQHFRAGKQIQVAEINRLRQQSKYSQADIVEKYLLSEYIRITHPERIINVLQDGWVEKIKYKDIDLSFELAALCKSHNEDSIKLRDMEASLLVGNNNYICLPFIGVLLRLADILDFDGNRTPKVLFANLGVSDPISLAEWQKHRAVEAWAISGDKITFNATCTHPAIEASIRRFCDYIDSELSACTNILSNLHDSIRRPFPNYYKIPLPSSVERSKINAKKDLLGNPIYIYKDTKFTLNKEQIIDILMGTKLYGQPSASLRELIQNSIDTCKLRQKMEDSWGRGDYTPTIWVRFIKEDGYTFLEVEDNGVGMDQDIIDKYYSKVGTSFYKSSDFFDLNASLKSSFIPTSRFGIGILSCFMVTDRIELQTKRIYEAHSSAQPLSLTISGQESIFYIKNGNRKTPGTTTRLQLRIDNPWVHLNPTQIIDFIRNTVPFPPFNVIIDAFGEKYTHSVRYSTDILFDSDQDKIWLENEEKLQSIRIEFNGEEGITGACIVSILEENGSPQVVINSTPKEIIIEGNTLPLQTKWEAKMNRVFKQSQTVDWNSVVNKVALKDANFYYKESRSKIALHGVEIPVSIFAQWTGQIYQYAIAHWPIFILADLNIGGSLDINLNSARTEILLDEKWHVFERKLLTLILLKIKESVGFDYWSQFKQVMNANPQFAHSIFVNTMNKIT
jgi:molecular chaperone HtpG